MYGKNTKVSMESVVLEDHMKLRQFVKQEVGYFDRAEVRFRLGYHLA